MKTIVLTIMLIAVSAFAKEWEPSQKSYPDQIHCYVKGPATSPSQSFEIWFDHIDAPARRTLEGRLILSSNGATLGDYYNDVRIEVNLREVPPHGNFVGGPDFVSVKASLDSEHYVSATKGASNPSHVVSTITPLFQLPENATATCVYLDGTITKGGVSGGNR